MRGPTRLIAVSIIAFLLIYLVYTTGRSGSSPVLAQSWDGLSKFNPVEHFRQPLKSSSRPEPVDAASEQFLPQDAQPLAALSQDALTTAGTSALETAAPTNIHTSPTSTSTAFEHLYNLAAEQTYSATALSASATLAPEWNETTASLSQKPLTGSKKALILAKPWTVDAAWMAHELSSWDTSVYNISNSTAPINPATPLSIEAFPPKGGAALAFLTWIVENYDNLSDVNFFISTLPVVQGANPDAVLGIRNIAPTLHMLNTSYVVHHNFTSMRCDFEPGCASTAEEVHPMLTSSDPSRAWHKHVVGAWNAFALNSKMPVPERIANPAGAQFAATRDQIRGQTKQQYQSVRQWVATSTLDEDALTQVMDSMYHIILGRNALDCPDDRVCFCDFYNRECLIEDEQDVPSHTGLGDRRKRRKWAT